MTHFKVGDRVRRQAQWRDYGCWTLGNRAVTVAEVMNAGDMKVAEDHRIWVMDRFDLVALAEPQPYAIQAKDFDPAKHERQLSNGTWSTSRPLSAATDAWLVVRDKAEPPLSLREFIETLDHTQFSAWDMAERLKSHGYATQYPSKAEEA